MAFKPIIKSVYLCLTPYLAIALGFGIHHIFGEYALLVPFTPDTGVGNFAGTDYHVLCRT